LAYCQHGGDKIFKDRWGTGPEIFNEQNAAAYGNWIANRYKNKTNIIWILGGDRYPRNEKDVAILAGYGTRYYEGDKWGKLLSAIILSPIF
jgi:hypothetical protein